MWFFFFIVSLIPLTGSYGSCFHLSSALYSHCSVSLRCYRHSHLRFKSFPSGYLLLVAVILWLTANPKISPQNKNLTVTVMVFSFICGSSSQKCQSLYFAASLAPLSRADPEITMWLCLCVSAGLASTMWRQMWWRSRRSSTRYEPHCRNIKSDQHPASVRHFEPNIFHKTFRESPAVNSDTCCAHCENN